MNSIVITGATSMLGIATIDACLGHEVNRIYAVIRPNSFNRDRIPTNERIKIVECEADKYNKLSTFIPDECDTFYHFSWCATGKDRDINVEAQALNIQYTLDAVQAAKELGCKKFIGAGSQAEYGRLDVDRIKPSSQVNPETPYGIAKYAAGKLAKIKAEQIGIICIWVRIFSIYGRNDKPTTLISSLINKLKESEHISLTEGTHRWDYLNSTDAGEAFYRIGEKVGVSKVYCLGSGEAKILREYIEIICDVMHSNQNLGYGEIPYTEKNVINLCADISELENDTGWRPKIPFRKGIIDLL